MWQSRQRTCSLGALCHDPQWDVGRVASAFKVRQLDAFRAVGHHRQFIDELLQAGCHCVPFRCAPLRIGDRSQAWAAVFLTVIQPALQRQMLEQIRSRASGCSYV